MNDINIFGVSIKTTHELSEKFKTWLTEIEEKTSGRNPDGSFKTGIIGGNLSLQITPTNLGTIYLVKDSYTKTEFNLTDFGSW